jgi:DNA repair protein RadD
MLYTISTQELIDQGYLCPLTYHELNLVDQNSLAFNKSKSEFDLEKFEQQFNPFIYQSSELANSLSGSVLMFAATITQAEELQKEIDNSAVITAKTPAKQREKFVADFRSGKLKVAINVGVLLLGFDKPDLQNIIICRPTRSVVLHTQLLGRGMRIHTGKTTCHVYDLVGNCRTLGKAESFKIEKVEDKWNVTSDSFPEGIHYRELYSYQLKPKKTPIQQYQTS